MPTTHVIADRVRQQTTTTGTGTLSLGTVPAGCLGVVAGVGSGKKARYSLVAETGGGWEVGEGTATAGSPDTFSRDVVYSSSAGGAKIALPAGTHTLDVTLDAKSANEATPRLLGIGNGVTLSAGTLAIDCMGSCDVLVAVALTANVTAVTPSNVPERCTVEFWVTHSGGPWTFPQGAWPAGTTLHGSYNLYTDGTISRFWLTTADGGTTWILECNAPAGGSTGDAYAISHEADATAHPASSIVNTPAGNIAATTVQAAIDELDSEKAATGHTHSGVYEPAGTVATHAALAQAHGISAFGATLVDDLDAATARTTLGIGTSISDGATLSTGLTFPNAGLKLKDLDGSNSLTLKWDSDDTADRTLSFRVNGSSRILTVNASTTLGGGTHSGTNTGDQTITLTGPVTGTGTGTFATTVTANAITLANLAQTTQYKLLGRSSAGTGNWEEISATANVLSFLQAADYAAMRTQLSLSNVANVDQLPRNGEVATVTGNTAIDSTYNGKIVDCNSASAITLTLNDSLAAGFQCYVLRRGAGTVAIARQTAGTLNGAATSISISAQWKSAFVMAYSTGLFAVDAG